MALQLGQTAYLCGGPRRVVLVTVLAMCQDGKLAISLARHWVQPGLGEAANDFESAVLDAVPEYGIVLGKLSDAVVQSQAMRELRASLVEQGLVRRWRFTGLTMLGRQLRRELQESPVGLQAVAVQGVAAIPDAQLQPLAMRWTDERAG
ncbi:TIGR04222 domain-containing membrane protein [Kribbella sancticallisti]|uniref:TIGR04222 domain-containing membrane protein n=1 Tax=Kribbella sancticallisti TaxID=460087 RepID=UPI0031D3BF8F